MPSNLAQRRRVRQYAPMQSERRRRRSALPVEALQHFLHAERSRLGVRALTVGGPDGRLIAGAGEEIERVARLGAHQDGAVATWRTRLGNRDVILTSWGSAMSAELAEGVRRILLAG